MQLLLVLVSWALAAPARSDEGRARVVVSPVQEVALGARALGIFLKGRSESDDRALAERLNQIGRRLVVVSDRPQHPYRFLAVKGEELQAFSFPGGTVCLTEGLARLYASDDELAFALGHELAHAVLRHHVSRRRLQEAITAGAPGDEALLEAVTSLFDRDTEIEADRFAALYAVRAGFRFTASHEALDRLGRALQGSREDRAHPDYDLRVEDLKAFRLELERAVGAFRQGVEALESGRPDEAVALLNLFVAEYPSSVAGRVNLGAAHIARVRLASGTPLGLSEVLPILPDPGIVVRGLVDTEAVNQARESFEQALRIQPDEVMAQAGLGLVHTRLGQLEAARSYLNQARAAAPGQAEIPLCLGNVEFLDGRHAEAAAHYAEALKLNPRWADAQRNLALACERLGRLREARDLWLELGRHGRFAPEAARHLDEIAPLIEELPPAPGGAAQAAYDRRPTCLASLWYLRSARSASKATWPCSRTSAASRPS